jgi:hypothetical protein
VGEGANLVRTVMAVRLFLAEEDKNRDFIKEPAQVCCCRQHLIDR